MSSEGQQFFAGCGCFALIAIIVAFILFGGVNIVHPGSAGVVQRLGTLDKNTRGSGVYLDIPFISRYTYYDLKVQANTSEQAAATKDLQDIKINTTVNYRLNADSVVDLYTNVGSMDDLNKTILAPAVSEAVKVTTTQYDAQNLLVNRAEVTGKVLEQLRKGLEKYPVEIVDVSLTNMEFTNPEFNKAIDQKQIAEQQALQAKYELEKVKVQAEQQRIQIQTLTPEILQRMWIEKWNGVLPTTVYSGNGQNLFIPFNK